MNAVTESSLADLLRDTARQIDDCREAPAPEAKQAFAAATNRVIGARNARVRSGPAADREATLRRLNALLSLMISIEFPLSGLHRERMGAVAKEMRAIADAQPA
jgi:hypothetical protein